ncbi:hypothetical protein niasHT_012729 [Heterodera trifolii]|uniref:Uncharacterized protein n=1 Tax=Heterodera trifolii TaxID=157864 RepID=A0ABD2L7K1_9BILA
MSELCVHNCDYFRQQRSVSFASNDEEEEEVGDKLYAEKEDPSTALAPLYSSMEPMEQQQIPRKQHQFMLEEGEEEEEEEPRVNLLICCFSFQLFFCARLVGWLSVVPLLLAMFLLPFASSSAFDLIPEIILLGSEMLCVLSLFFGLQHHQHNYLRPFLFFGVIWNLTLLLLLLFAVYILILLYGFYIELFVAPARFCVQLDLTVQTLLYGGPSHHDASLMPEERQYDDASNNTTFTMAFCFVALLAIIILLNGWLLNIVLLAYFHMQKLQNEDKCIRQKLLVEPMRRRTLVEEDIPAPICYSSLALTNSLATTFPDKSYHQF